MGIESELEPLIDAYPCLDKCTWEHQLATNYLLAVIAQELMKLNKTLEHIQEDAQAMGAHRV